MLSAKDNTNLKPHPLQITYFAVHLFNTTPMQSSEDTALLSLIRAGDHKAFKTCFNRHWPALYAFAMKILASADDAKDVVQTVYISLWSRRERMQVLLSLERYLMQAVRFQSLKKLQEMMNRPEELDRAQEYILPVLNNIWEKMGVADIFREIEEQLTTLPGKTRTIFLLSRRQQLSIPEIAHWLNLSEKTVRNS